MPNYTKPSIVVFRHFFGRQTIGRQQSFQERRFAEIRLGDKGLSSLYSC